MGPEPTPVKGTGMDHVAATVMSYNSQPLWKPPRSLISEEVKMTGGGDVTGTNVSTSLREGKAGDAMKRLRGIAEPGNIQPLLTRQLCEPRRREVVRAKVTLQANLISGVVCVWSYVLVDPGDTVQIVHWGLLPARRLTNSSHL